MSCLSSWASASLREQARVSFPYPYPRPQATPWPQTACLSPALCLDSKKQRLKPAESAPLRREQVRASEDSFSDNLFVELIQSILRDIYHGVIFLLKQPKELQYLEFPSLQSAAKMALFTIAVVMVLIVFLATVDSAFSYIVASMFRRVK